MKGFQISNDRWLKAVVREISKTFENPSWFDYAPNSLVRVSLIEKLENAHSLTPVDIAKSKFKDIIAILEKNELSPDEIQMVVIAITPIIKTTVDSHLQKFIDVLKSETATDWDFVNTHRSLTIAPYALDRFQKILTRKLEGYVKEMQIKDGVPNETDDGQSKEHGNDNHPFTTDMAFEIFLFLENGYASSKKSRWTYILEFIKDNRIDNSLVESDYFRWIRSKYAPEMKTPGKQYSANSDNEFQRLTELYKTYPS